MSESIITKIKDFCSKYNGKFRQEGDYITCILDDLFTGDPAKDYRISQKLAEDLPELFDRNIHVEPMMETRKMTIHFTTKDGEYGTLDVENIATGFQIEALNLGNGEFDIGITPIDGMGQHGCFMGYNTRGKEAIFSCSRDAKTKIGGAYTKLYKFR